MSHSQDRLWLARWELMVLWCHYDESSPSANTADLIFHSVSRSLIIGLLAALQREKTGVTDQKSADAWADAISKHYQLFCQKHWHLSLIPRHILVRTCRSMKDNYSLFLLDSFSIQSLLNQDKRNSCKLSWAEEDDRKCSREIERLGMTCNNSL